jgi:23S rRNA (guanosine2251-2'-O)-methyltransferase
VDWRHPRALRASTGSLLRLPVLEVDLSGLRAALAPRDPLWLGLSPRGGVSLWDSGALPAGAVVLVVGSEGEGLSEEAVGAIDRTVTIPMAAPVESINVTAAAAVVLFELARQRRHR